MKTRLQRTAALAIVPAILALSACAAPDANVSEAPAASAVADLASVGSFADTEARLRSAIETRDFRLFTVVNHGAGAKSVGADIGGNKLFIFGNPKGGTPLMQADPRLGLDLPLKVLLYTDGDGNTRLAAGDIRAAVRAKGVAGQDARLDKMEAALSAIMAEAAG